jgi:hypothetical protein
MSKRLELLERIGKDVEEARKIGIVFPELRERMCNTMSDLIKLMRCRRNSITLFSFGYTVLSEGVIETENKRQFFDYVVYVAIRVSASNREKAKEIVNDQIINPYRWPSPIISLSITKIKPVAK